MTGSASRLERRSSAVTNVYSDNYWFVAITDDSAGHVRAAQVCDCAVSNYSTMSLSFLSCAGGEMSHC